jgi:hypothetical protein
LRRVGGMVPMGMVITINLVKLKWCAVFWGWGVLVLCLIRVFAHGRHILGAASRAMSSCNLKTQVYVHIYTTICKRTYLDIHNISIYIIHHNYIHLKSSRYSSRHLLRKQLYKGIDTETPGGNGRRK